MRRLLTGLLAGALLFGCSGGNSSSKQATTTLPESTVNNGIDTANRVLETLRASGIPIGPTVAHPTSDKVFQDLEGLTGKVDFHDMRLLSSGSDIDEGIDGGSVEVYRDERFAVAASRDRGGYVFVKGFVLLHLAGELAPEWAMAYRDALNKAA